MHATMYALCKVHTLCDCLAEFWKTSSLPSTSFVHKWHNVTTGIHFHRQVEILQVEQAIHLYVYKENSH